MATGGARSAGRNGGSGAARSSGGGRTAPGAAPAPGKPVVTEHNQRQLNQIASNIAGTTEQLRRRLAQVEADIKVDLKGQKEYKDYRTKLLIQRADLQARIDRNKAWIASFERNSDNGAFEEQYERLVDEIQTIYEGAKEFHAHGIDLLIKEFSYHVNYKRWNDTFSAVPYKPK